VTAKGNLNFRAILNRRAELVEKLYTTDFDGKIIVE
jgi:hypothetical protein